MWPILLDMSKEESMQHLRCLEIDAFSGLVNALRAQGTLNKEKLHLLRETSNMLHISQERHKAEIRRVVNDERLNTIAYHVNGERHCGQEWADEGQRLIPLMPRIAPQTAYSAIADEVADATSKLNKQLPLPASTERKKMASPTHLATASASSSSLTPAMYRNVEVDRKRKLSDCVLAQHLMAPPKISKIQQIYRQRSKSRLKEQLGKLKPPEVTPPPQQPPLNSAKATPTPTPTTTPKINILQNITTSLPCRSFTSAQRRGSKKQPKPPPECAATATQIAANASKTITTTDGQKLIVVSTHSNHTITPPPSILQRTLTTVPYKTLTVNPKFRIVPKVSPPVPKAKATATTKQDIVNMRNVANKKMIPFSNVQVLNTKTGYKVLPIGPTHAPKVVKSNFAHSKLLNHKTDSRDSRDTRVTASNNVSVEVMDLTVTELAASKDGCITIQHDFETGYIGEICNRVNGLMESIDDSQGVAEVTTTTNDSPEYHHDNHDNHVAFEDVHKMDVDMTSHVTEVTQVTSVTTQLQSEESKCEIKMADISNHIDTHTIPNDNGVCLLTESAEPDSLNVADSNDLNHKCDNTESQNMRVNDESDLSEQLHTTRKEQVCVQHLLDHVETIEPLEPLEVIDDIAQSEIEVFEEKVDFDSSVYIYGETIGNIGNHDASEEVIIDGVGDQPTEVLNAVHALDESFPNIKNVRS